jgi:aryl-alcohol dehydrogenase-like predicted oxidoreductase
VVSIQNPYNLLNRTFDIGLAEMCIREEVGLLGYSPMAFGVLSGSSGRRVARGAHGALVALLAPNSEHAARATAAYAELAARHGLDLAQMSLAFCRQQRFMTSVLIGATTLQQLRTNLGSAELTLSTEVMKDIEGIHRAHPNPCP